jgi:hypothetical protein
MAKSKRCIFVSLFGVCQLAKHTTGAPWRTRKKLDDRKGLILDQVRDATAMQNS